MSVPIENLHVGEYVAVTEDLRSIPPAGSWSPTSPASPWRSWPSPRRS